MTARLRQCQRLIPPTAGAPSGTSRSRESIPYLHDVVTREVDCEAEFCRHHRHRLFTLDSNYVKRPVVEFDDIPGGQT
jgi:hypothetical protein